MRSIEQRDIEYLTEAAKEFTEHTIFELNEQSYAEQLALLIESPVFLSSVSGDPPTGHCAAVLMPSLYDDTQTICRILSTWGEGGLGCFLDVQAQAKKRGADFLLADSFMEPRIIKFYEKQGLELADSIYQKVL